jgi:hypothetical protein
MALINCSECKQEVSDKAESCPKCGAPITTAQETSNRYKLQTLISVLLILFGVVWIIAIVINPESEPYGVPGFVILIGLGWYIVNRIRVWWHVK